MKSLCVITIKLNTLTDIPYQMTVGGRLCTYVKTCESGRVKDFEQRSRIYNTVRYNAGFFPWTRRPRYNGVAVYLRNTLLSHKQTLKKRSTLMVVRDT